MNSNLKPILSLLLITCAHLALSDEQGAPSSPEVVSKPAEAESSSTIPHVDYSTVEANAASVAANVPGAAQVSKNDDEVTYDQRQNGSQNVRIHLDDVTLIVAPSEGILTLFAQQGAAQNQAVVPSAAPQPAAAANDHYNDFNELLNAANYLKSQGQAHPGKHQKKCTGDRCKGKRTKISLSRYLLPILANRHNTIIIEEENAAAGVGGNIAQENAATSQ